MNNWKGKKGGGGKKQYPPKAGAMYITKSKKGTKYFKLSVNTEVLQNADVDDKGRIHLVGFVNDYKEDDRHPDVWFQVSEPKENKGFKAKPKKRYEEPEEDEDEDSNEEEAASEEEDEEIPF